MNNSSLSLHRTIAQNIMSPRIKRIRKVLNPPCIKGFKPYGPDVPTNNNKVVNLLYEEYEALRLCDYDMINHHDSSLIMGVSRPTFTRIYASARQKIAKAFVEGSQMSIEGGKVYFDSDWYHCKKCNCFFSKPDKDKKVDKCPLCSSLQINICEDEDINDSDNGHDTCICPECGFEQAHHIGNQCNRDNCPKCNHAMIRKGHRKCNK